MWRCFIFPNTGRGCAVHSEERMSFFKREEGKCVTLVRVGMSVCPRVPTNVSVSITSLLVGVTSHAGIFTYVCLPTRLCTIPQGPTFTSARKHLPSALWNIRHVERSIILPSRKTCEDSCVSLSSFLLCTLLTISCNRSVCIFGNCSFTQSVLFHTHKHLYQVEHLTGALEVTD